MSRKIFFVSTLFVVLTLIVGVAMFNRNFSAEGANPRIHKKDLSEHGLLIVNSTDSTYEIGVDEWLNYKREDFRRVARTLKPFSVFIKNTTNKDIIAYKLNWELKMSDGRVVNYPRTYFATTYLMGVPRSALLDSAMESVKKGSKRFFTMIPTPFETSDGSGSGGSGSGAFATRIQNDEVEKLQAAGRTRDITPIIAKLSEQLNLATDITVSIESALFDDGAFVGPPGDQEFVKYKASITAKRDLFMEMRAAVKTDKTPLNEVLDRVASVAAQDTPLPTPKAEFGAYYNYFRKLQAEEVTRARQAIGDDAKTVSSFLERLDKWIIPFEQSQR